MRYKSLDIWRGIACLMVVVFHSSFYVSDDCTRWSWLTAITNRMWIGVPMFFVISGYCISATAQATVRKGHPISEYFKRRLRRIFPPWIIFLSLSIALVGVLELTNRGVFYDSIKPITLPWRLGAWQWVGNFTLTEGWRKHLVGPPQHWFMGHGWTLGYEEQFYAVTGVLLLIAPRHFFIGAALVSAAVFALMPYTTGASGFFFDGYWLQFAAGILVYFAINKLPARYRWLAAVPLVCALLYFRWGRYILAPNGFSDSCFVAASFAIALLALWPLDRFGEHWSLAPLRLCGLWTYSIYLVHWPICKSLSHLCWMGGIHGDGSTLLVTIPLCIAASLGAAWPFHVFVERRFLNS